MGVAPSQERNTLEGCMTVRTQSCACFALCGVCVCVCVCVCVYDLCVFCAVWCALSGVL